MKKNHPNSIIVHLCSICAREEIKADGGRIEIADSTAKFFGVSKEFLEEMSKTMLSDDNELRGVAG